MRYLLVLLCLGLKMAFIGYTTGFTFAPTAPVFSVVLFVVLSFWVLWFGPKVQSVLLILLDAGLSVLLFADVLFYRFYHSFLTIPILSQAWQVSGVQQSVLSLFQARDLLVFADLVLLIPLFWYLNKRDEKRGRAVSFKKRLAISGGLFVLGMAMLAFLSPPVGSRPASTNCLWSK